MMSELSKQLNTVEEYVQLIKDIIRLIVDLKCKFNKHVLKVFAQSCAKYSEHSSRFYSYFKKLLELYYLIKIGIYSNSEFYRVIQMCILIASTY